MQQEKDRKREESILKTDALIFAFLHSPPSPSSTTSNPPTRCLHPRRERRPTRLSMPD